MHLCISTELNMIMRKTFEKKTIPLSQDINDVKDNDFNHRTELLSFFGKGNNLGFDEEPEEIPFDKRDIVL